MGKSTDLTLYHYWRSSCSWRVRWALELKQLKYESRTVNLLKGEQLSSEYRRLNPAGTVPCLVTSEMVMTESLPIIEWLDEKFSGHPLLPNSPDERFKSRRIAAQIYAGIQPLQNLSVMKKVSDQSAEQQAWARHWIERGLVVVEELVQQSAGSFCVGSEITLADLCLIPQCYNARRFNIDLAKFPTIARIFERSMATKECIAAAPENQPGAV